MTVYKNVLTMSLNYTIPGRKKGNVLFNDTLNTFYLRLSGVEYYTWIPFRRSLSSMDLGPGIVVSIFGPEGLTTF